MLIYVNKLKIYNCKFIENSASDTSKNIFAGFSTF